MSPSVPTLALGVAARDLPDLACASFSNGEGSGNSSGTALARHHCTHPCIHTKSEATNRPCCTNDSTSSKVNGPNCSPPRDIRNLPTWADSVMGTPLGQSQF